MAELENRLPLNVAGSFYVDDQCSECDVCRSTAPHNIQRDPASGQSYFFKQPENDAERAQCIEAMEGCPVEAIGNDG